MLKNWSGNRIEYMLKEAGFRQIDVAKKGGWTPGWIHRVIHDGEMSEPVHTAVAELIGFDKKDIWPEIYLADSMVA